MDLRPEAMTVTLCTLVYGDPAEEDIIALRLAVVDPPDGSHDIPLSVPEATRLRGLLASGGTLSDEDGPWLSVEPGGGALVLIEEGWRYGGLTRLDDALAAALKAAKDHPPRQAAVDPELARIAGTDSSGAPQSVAVQVEVEMFDPTHPRLMLDWVGTWWLSDDEAAELAGALDGGMLALHAGENPAPWLVVARREGRVYLQLFDSLVAEDGGDGVLWLTEEAAAALAAGIRAALAWAAGNPPRVFRAPEPGPREILRVDL